MFGRVLRRLADVLKPMRRFGLAHRAERAHDQLMARDEVAFVVEGWPPAKNEAKSMLAAGHPYADRTLHLLTVAKVAVMVREFGLQAQRDSVLAQYAFANRTDPRVAGQQGALHDRAIHRLAA
jgi:hypothetical protein